MNIATGKSARPEGLAALPRHRFPRIIRWGLIFALCVGIYSLLGFLAVPWVIRAQLPALVSDYTRGTASVESLDEVRFNPFAFFLELRGFELRETSGPPVLSFGDLRADLGFWASLRGEMHFDRIELAEPYLRIAIDRRERLNLSSLLGNRRSPRKNTGSVTIPLTIDQLAVSDGRLEFQDQSRKTPFRHAVFPVSAELSHFVLGKETANAAAPYRLTAVSESGAALRLEGTFTAAPVRAEGRLRLDGLKAQTLREYARDRLGSFTVKDGVLALSAHYLVTGDPWRVAVRQGTLDLKQLQFADSAGRVLVDIPAAQAREITADTQARRFAIGSVASDGGRLDTWLTPEGRLNLAAWLPATPDTPPYNEKREKNAGWSVRVGTVTLDRYAVAFEDRRTPPAVRLNFSPVRLEMKNVARDGGSPIQVALNAGLNQSGRLGVTGTLNPKSRSATLNVTLGQLALPEFQPYLSRFIQLDLVKGLVNLRGTLDIHRDGANPPVVNYQGDASFDDWETRLPGNDKPLLSWQRLAFSGLSFQSEPAQLHIADAAAEQLYAQVTVRPDRTLNLVQAFAGPQRPEQSPTGQSGNAAPLPLTIDTIRLENSRADFADLSIQPHFSTGIHNLHGTLHGVNSRPGQHARLLLEGQVDRYAPVRIEGRMNLFSPARFANVDMRFTNVDMTTLSPYAGKFAGYRIKMGKMSLDLHYRLKERRLDSDNRIVLNRLTLGEPVPGSRAPNLPLHLAIALLKDSQGRIDLDLPIRGDLSDPKVSFPGLVGHVLRGLVRKVVTSPFQALARLTGGGEDLSDVGFNPGEAELGNEQVARLAKLAEALRERPALYLQITGVAEPERDRQALAEKELIDRIKAAKLLEQDRPVDAESLRDTVLSRSEYERYIARLYAAKTGGKSPENTVPIESMRHALLQPAAIGPARLRTLAHQRTEAIRDYLVQSEGLPPDRIFSADVQVQNDGGPLVRSRLGLNAS